MLRNIDKVAEKIKTVLKFGIIDPHNSQPVFIKYFDDGMQLENVGAVVHSNNKKNLKFLPIDHNKFLGFNNGGNDVSAIDGCVYGKYSIIFFELCDLKKGVYSKIKGQFEETIKQFEKLLSLNQYKNKKFYLCRTNSITHRPNTNDINHYADYGFSFHVVVLSSCRNNEIIV